MPVGNKNQYIFEGKQFMSKKFQRVIPKFKFCCYEFDRDDDEDERNKFQKVNILMLNRDQKSNIKFDTAFRNKNVPIYKVLEDLYEENPDVSQILPFLSRKRVNPQLLPNRLSDRDDLEYYIPQLVTYMVIQCNLENHQLNQLVLKACMTDFYFAHSVYFYLESLATNKDGEEVYMVRNFIQVEFIPKMQMYNHSLLSGHQLAQSLIHGSTIPDYIFHRKMSINEENQSSQYGLLKYPDPPPQYPETIQRVQIKKYDGIGFEETPKFWTDLVDIGEQISLEAPNSRVEKLSELIKFEINSKLPAVVYIPFYSQKIRLYTVLCVWEGRVFSTKERAPFSIWVELYREEEEHEQTEMKEVHLSEDSEEEEVENEGNKKENILKRIYEKLSKPFTIADGENTLKIKKFFKEKTSIFEEGLKKRVRFRSFYEKNHDDDEKQEPLSLSHVYETKSDGISRKSSSHSVEEMLHNDTSESSEDQCQYFPTKSSQVINEFKKKSIYRNLKSWRMVHLMVKIGDDLKQEQFAMQLINRFQYIFEKENVDCLVRSYEVMSLGPNYGLIQMINDITTFDGLFKKLSTKKMTLKDFFQKFYKDDKGKAKKNFMRSLAGYSLVTYFLQVKDRHNGNILLHRDGSIIHIDFGFFLTNAPGKGVELQKKVPFKLLTAYVEVLGSLNSEMFFQFRRLFYHGFKAIINNQEMILSIVKMMYKSQGEMMECFKKGEKAIQELESRFNPEGNVENFCYDLINNSLDNWRAKWYDKFQYFLQKIYY